MYKLQTFKEIIPNLILQLQHIITRLGTWLNAAVYYGNNFDEVKSVIEIFDQNEATSIWNVQAL